MRWLALLALLWPLSAEAVLSFGAHSETSGTGSLSVAHTPGSNPEGVAIFCVAATSTDVFSGATYDGEALTQIANAADTADEPGFVEAYFLGTGVNTTSPATAACTSTGADGKWMYVITINGAGDLQLSGDDFCTDAENQDDPTCTITTSGGAVFGVAGAFSGQTNEVATFAGVGYAKGHSHDFGSITTASQYSISQQDSGNIIIGWTTSASDDWASVGLAIEQVISDAKIFIIGED